MTEPAPLSYATPALAAPGRAARAAWLQRLAPLLGLVLVTAFFSALRPDTFLTFGNFNLILTQTAVVGTAALGMTIIIVSGGIDLSVGSHLALCTVVVAWVLTWGAPTPVAVGAAVGLGCLVGLGIGAMVIGHVGRVAAAVVGVAVGWALRSEAGLSWWAAAPAGLLAAAAVAAANELFIRRLELPPFIVTLGLLAFLRGLALQLAPAGGRVDPGRETWLNELLNPFAASNPLLPWGVWLMLALALAVTGVLRHTRFGRHVFAVGSSEQTARLCGVPVGRVKLLAYVVAGGLTGLAGLMFFGTLNGMGKATEAEGYELRVIAAVVIGGASLNGGEGTVLGSLTGALLMGVIASGSTKLGWRPPSQLMITGAIIVLAVALDRLRHRRAP